MALHFGVLKKNEKFRSLKWTENHSYERKMGKTVHSRILTPRQSPFILDNIYFNLEHLNAVVLQTNANSEWV